SLNFFNKTVCSLTELGKFNGALKGPGSWDRLESESAPMKVAAAFRILWCSAIALAVASCVPPPVKPVNPPIASLVLLDQGANWTLNARRDFYSRDQGSRIMLLRWMLALKQPDGEPFMAESLGRYGYLPNSDIPGMPIGFTLAGSSGNE